MRGRRLDQIGQIREHSLHSLRDVLENTLQTGLLPPSPSSGTAPGAILFRAGNSDRGVYHSCLRTDGSRQRCRLRSCGRHHVALREDDQPPYGLFQDGRDRRIRVRHRPRATRNHPCSLLKEAGVALQDDRLVHHSPGQYQHHRNDCFPVGRLVEKNS